MSASSPPAPTLPVVECTNYARFVVAAVKAATTGLKLNQEVLRTALSLCSSYLVTDTSTNDDPTSGSQTWFTGLNQLVDLLVALHARDELEIDTLNAASMACSELERSEQLGRVGRVQRGSPQSRDQAAAAARRGRVYLSWAKRIFAPSACTPTTTYTSTSDFYEQRLTTAQSLVQPALLQFDSLFSFGSESKPERPTHRLNASKLATHYTVELFVQRTNLPIVEEKSAFTFHTLSRSRNPYRNARLYDTSTVTSCRNSCRGLASELITYEFLMSVARQRFPLVSTACITWHAASGRASGLIGERALSTLKNTVFSQVWSGSSLLGGALAPRETKKKVGIALNGAQSGTNTATAGTSDEWCSSPMPLVHSFPCEAISYFALLEYGLESVAAGLLSVIMLPRNSSKWLKIGLLHTSVTFPLPLSLAWTLYPLDIAHRTKKTVI
uniref:Uncharacterized protein n=1 Tax=Mycena chlorophos TaxID=658473 RepID=A0ABQ0M866_MYCCL|nr:predicted protein [Mycena chlorophos]